MLFKDSTVVITGVGTGIGRGLVAGFVRDGANVVGISRTKTDLEETAILYGQGRMHYTVGDVSVATDVERLFAETEERHGKIDILINNAAVYPKLAFLESNIEEWIFALAINVGGIARCCHRVLPGMLERGHGRILNVGSFAYRDPIPNSSVYSASKGAVTALTRAIAREVDHKRYPDVLVNEFLPGVYRTRMTPEGGDDPMDAYSHARVVASLPANGPHGRIFLKGELFEENRGMRARLMRVVKKSLPLGRE